jgi:hypothetical protein
MWSVEDVKGFLGMTDIKVLAGDVPDGDYSFTDGIMSNGSVSTNLLTELIDLKQETEQDGKNFILKSLGAIAGLIVLGPLAAIFAFIAIGNNHRVCAIVTLKQKKPDGTNFQFLSIMKDDIYQELLAIKLANTTS